MKLVLQNSSLKLRRVANSVTFKPSDFENPLSDSIIAGATSTFGPGSVRTVSEFTASQLVSIPEGSKTAASYGTGYPLNDGYCTFALYNANDVCLVTAAPSTVLQLSDYPTATKFRAAWRNTSSNDATFVFSE